MSDGVLLTRLFVFLVLGWPLLAIAAVYAFRRSSIPRSGEYFLKSVGIAYAMSLLGPVVMLAVLWLAGSIPEIAMFYTIVLGVPLFAVLPVVVAIRVSRSS